MSIKSKDLIEKAKERNSAKLAAALKSGDEAQMAAAMAGFCSDIHDAVLQQAAEDIAMNNQDTAILTARGQRALTSAEMSYYTGLIEAMKSGNPKMALTNYQVAMPDTIIDGVIGRIRQAHPLLDRIAMHNTSYLTRMIMNAQAAQLARWGAITDAVTKELSGSLKEIDVTLCKLSAFLLISNDLLELGPKWLDQYIQEILSEAIAIALETAIVDGTGKNEPIGMTRDVSEDVTITAGVYPRMDAETVADLKPVTMGGLASKLARDPNDATKARVVSDMVFLVNPFDYWEKVMPATCYRRPDGTWIRDVLPIPADIFQTVALEKGKALLGMPNYYFMGLGIQGKKGAITKDESVKFLEDQTAYKAKLQGNGRPMDEYSFLLLDISDLQVEIPTPVTVQGTVATEQQVAEQGT